MKLSLVFELLLIFVLLAFAASKSVRNQKNSKKGIQNKIDEEKQDENSINKYCKCSEAYCNCCRDFSVPLVSLDGPGCASLMYLNGDKMSVSLSFGRKVITNKTLSSRKPSPVCMPLPGGISKFCGRVYNIARSGEEFRACLGLELQAKKAVEAAVRVSCFKFGPRGVHMEPADPLPLVPQNEKIDDDEDDDDDDDDDDFGLGDDDDDADLEAINDVDGADYTGFSILGEDILGDLFGGSSTGTKKSNKNKKKQAPPPSTTTTTTTTTRRPRPSRRPTRRPNTRSTTPRPPRTTTVRVRPGPGNRRPTRRPSTRRPGSRPTRRPQTSTTELTTASPISSTIPTKAVTTPMVIPISSTSQTTERSHLMSTANEETFEPVVIVTQRPVSTLSITTPKPVTNFEDPGLEMSLAQLTGQLSVMPVTPIISNDGKDAGMMTTRKEQVSYEKIETITPKATTISFATTSEERVNDDMVQIVQSLDSSSEENVAEKETMTTDESRAHGFSYEGLSLPKKKNRQFSVEDLDVLDLTEIGESVGDQLGIFEKNKRQNRNKKGTKVQGNKDDNSDEYDVLGLSEIGETVGHELGIFGGGKRQNRNKNVNKQGDKDNSDYDVLVDVMSADDEIDKLTLGLKRSENGNNKKNRRRQNKMMRGEWSQV